MQNARHINRKGEVNNYCKMQDTSIGKVRLIIIAKYKTHQIRKGEVNNYCKMQDTSN